MGQRREQSYRSKHTIQGRETRSEKRNRDFVPPVLSSPYANELFSIWGSVL